MCGPLEYALAATKQNAAGEWIEETTTQFGTWMKIDKTMQLITVNSKKAADEGVHTAIVVVKLKNYTAVKK